MRMTDKELELMTAATAIAHQNILLEKQEPTEKEIFLGAYEILKDRNNWCQGHLRTEETRADYATQIELPKTPLNAHINTSTYQVKTYTHYSYCTIGAIYKAAGIEIKIQRMDEVPFNVAALVNGLHNFVKRLGFYGGIADFNDVSQHSHVIQVLEIFGREKGWL